MCKKIHRGGNAEQYNATLDDLREAETTLTQLERTSRRVLGGAHPVTVGIEKHLRRLRIVLGIREMAETPPGS